MFVCQSHPSEMRWPVRRCHSHWFYLPRCHWRDSEHPATQDEWEHDIFISAVIRMCFLWELKNKFFKFVNTAFITKRGWFFNRPEEQGFLCLTFSVLEKHQSRRWEKQHIHTYSPFVSLLDTHTSTHTHLYTSSSATSHLRWVSSHFPCLSVLKNMVTVTITASMCGKPMAWAYVIKLSLNTNLCGIFNFNQSERETYACFDY